MIKPETEKSHDLTSSVSLADMELSSSLRSSILKSFTMSNHLPLPLSPAPGTSPQTAANTVISESSPKKQAPSKQRISSPQGALVPVEAQMQRGSGKEVYGLSCWAHRSALRWREGTSRSFPEWITFCQALPMWTEYAYGICIKQGGKAKGDEVSICSPLCSSLHP